MTKENYIRDRENGRVDLEAAYYMYLNTNVNVSKVSIEEFVNKFTIWIRNTGPILYKYFDYYDEMFKIEKGDH